MPSVPVSTLTARASWRRVDFISDLHLQADQPAVVEAWARQLRDTPADAVFILGDLFEVWVGDDAMRPGSFEAQCADVLRQAGARCAVFIMRGNRDFLLGPDLFTLPGVHELADPTLLTFGPQRLLLTHGDLLCTDDVDYQRFRQQVRSAAWQRDFLARPLAERQALARQMRQHSQARHASDTLYASVDDALARRWLTDADATRLIHGHTHAPRDHALGPDDHGRALTRHVLSDWHLDADQRRLQLLRADVDGTLARVDL